MILKIIKLVFKSYAFNVQLYLLRCYSSKDRKNRFSLSLSLCLTLSDMFKNMCKFLEDTIARVCYIHTRRTTVARMHTHIYYTAIITS